MNADDTFFAWLDGELSGAEAAKMEARVAADPELARLAEQHRALQAQLKRAFDPVAEAPVPMHLTQALGKPAQVIDFAAAKKARELKLIWRPATQWAAIAATLVLGVFIGTLAPRHQNAPVTIEGGALYASAGLDQALNSELASAPSAGPVRIGLTFRDQSGVICRTFTQAKDAGLACRSGNRWLLRGLFPAPEGQSDTYRMAAGMDPNLATLVSSSIVGEPLDAAQERTALQRRWK